MSSNKKIKKNADVELTPTVVPSIDPIAKTNIRLLKWILGASMVLLVLVGVACWVTTKSGQGVLDGCFGAIKATRMPKETIDLLYPEHKAYLGMPQDIRRKSFKDPKYRFNLAARTWKCKNAGNLEIGKEYPSWITDDTPPRILNVPGIPNIRDMGGWKVDTGTRIKQGLILRSSELNAKSWYGVPGRSFLTMQSRNVLVNQLRVKTDLDLRWSEEVAGMEQSPMGGIITWENVPFGLYQWMDGPKEKDAFKKAFMILSNTNNLPALVHCVYGKDRTGTLCYILEGILGVSDDDKLKDWETSAFWITDPGFIHERGIDGLVNYLKIYPGRTVNERCVSYAISCGVMQSEIEHFRNIMLEKTEQ